MLKLFLLLSIVFYGALLANDEDVKSEAKIEAEKKEQEKVEKVEEQSDKANTKVKDAEDKLEKIKAMLQEARAELEAAKLDSREADSDTRQVKNEIEDKKPIKEDKTDDAIVILKDKSGLSENEVREKAKELDKEEAKVNIQDVIETIQDSDGTQKIDISKIQKEWKNLSPKAENYDWVQTKSGEWFKGDIKTLYRDELLFDSDEVGLYTFDFEDISQIRSYQVIGVNIDKVAIFEGIIRYKDEKITIIQGDKRYTFPSNMIVSLAPEGENELNNWSSKVTVSLDVRSGNSDQKDFSAKANIARLTSTDRLTIDYLGRTSEKNGEETANDHRINEKYDRFITKRFFWSPIFTEFYKDKYKNIDLQATGGVGIGYMLADTKDITWDVSSGPAFIYTRYYEVEEGSSISSSSPALQLSTKFEFDMTKRIDFIFDYRMTLANKDAGTFKHHMVTTFENELTDWLDLDITYVWDFVQTPEKDGDGDTPLSSDHQVLIGLSVEF